MINAHDIFGGLVVEIVSELDFTCASATIGAVFAVEDCASTGVAFPGCGSFEVSSSTTADFSFCFLSLAMIMTLDRRIEVQKSVRL